MKESERLSEIEKLKQDIYKESLMSKCKWLQYLEDDLRYTQGPRHLCLYLYKGRKSFKSQTTYLACSVIN